MMYCLIPVRSISSLTPPVSAGLIKHRTSVGFKPSCGTGDAGVQHYGPWGLRAQNAHIPTLPRHRQLCVVSHCASAGCCCCLQNGVMWVPGPTHLKINWNVSSLCWKICMEQPLPARSGWDPELGTLHTAGRQKFFYNLLSSLDTKA